MKFIKKVCGLKILAISIFVFGISACNSYVDNKSLTNTEYDAQIYELEMLVYRLEQDLQKLTEELENVRSHAVYARNLAEEMAIRIGGFDDLF